MYYKIEELLLNLKYTWKIARNSSDFKRNLIVTIGDNFYVGKGEAAPNTRYGETPEELVKKFNSLIDNGLDKVAHFNDLQHFLASHHIFNSLRFALEQAFINYWCKKEGKNLHQFLGLEPDKSVVQTVFSLPIMPVNEIGSFFIRHQLNRFKGLKIKINKENAKETIFEVAKLGAEYLYVDGNETWQNPDEVLNWQKEVRNLPIVMLEQPMPSTFINEYKALKKESIFPIIADESVTNQEITSEFHSQFHGINMKLMKAGGILKGLEMLQQAKSLNMLTMVGCMVETSLGISAAIPLCNHVNFVDLDGFLIIENEPFNLLTEQNGIISTTEFI